MTARPAGPQPEALVARDPAAWKALVTAHGPMLLGYVTRMVGSRSLAEDIVQDGFVSAFKNIDRYDGRASMKTWLSRIVHNRAIDELRRRRKYVAMPETEVSDDYFDAGGRWAAASPASGPEDRLDARRMVDRVRRAIDQLPHGYREVLLLKEIHGFTNDEISEALETSQGNVRVRIHRARKALRAAVLGADAA